ncbi:MULTISPECIES: hypothetical protein [Mammaliicoccus]|uniref:hypothetical protein n=1 Tax=Mammaliicoccus TaxID=2803850 RepID=UPI001C4FCFE6|nr:MULTISPECIES: hypothetical protein [Mammaliicoccus]MBW0764001.1 hypothetical protein [Mammaliicoccus fleurettii]MEB7806042.1 hypothetical protein [Mammaliicoccus fleurettii]
MSKGIDIPRGKLVGENGAGSIYIDTKGISYLVSSVDNWYKHGEKIKNDEFKIRDSRLEKLLKVSHFREVPVYKQRKSQDESTNIKIEIPLQRFPRYHYCSDCGTIDNFQPASSIKKKPCLVCKKTKDFIQFPIVIVCENGHISDFPCFDFVHGTSKKNSLCKGEIKVLKEGTSILNWKLKCIECGKTHSLNGVTGKTSETGITPFQKEMNQGVMCWGNRPWSGPNNQDGKCGANPTAILRNSLNVYQPETISVLSLTDTTQNQVNSYTAILNEEFNALSKNTNDIYLEIENSFENTNEAIIKKVNYVKKLEELVIQTSFQRLSPSNEEESLEKAKNLDNGSLLFSNQEDEIDWYPAKKLYGEGIFIEFNKSVLDSWSNELSVNERFEKYKLRIQDDYLNQKFNTPISVLLHTLSHGLMKEFSKNSGYSNAAIREKLYFQNGNYGLLIYVTDTDKDGTFGGLVRLAKQNLFNMNFNQMLKNMEWCSSDPVCFEIGENQGQGLNYSNGSACHNCSFVPSTSCSFRNCFLDRDYVFRKDSPCCISNYFSWFENVKIEVKDKGVSFPYDNWSDAVAYDSSEFYLDNDFSTPDFMEGIVVIDKTEFIMKYYWEKENLIVLYNQSEQEEKIKDEYIGKIQEYNIILEP